ncbi:MAG: hypothetical protein D3910_01575 [Candidatus Electrothrix sp. ATG2]|nr:hypothetical protein [Candidatus Electrothrix sp. ATG2]
MDFLNVAICLLASWVTALTYRVRNRTINRIKKGVAQVEKHLRDEKFLPEVVVAFSRTSAVFAGILSVRMDVPEVIAINRRSFTNDNTGVRIYQVGCGISLDPDAFASQHLLIVDYFVETGATLQAGIEYLLSQGIPKDRMKIAALYCTPAARKKFPEIFIVHETSEEVLEELPWIDGAYSRF